MSDLSPLSGDERKSNFGAVRSVDDHLRYRAHLAPLTSLSLAGQEPGQTIPLADSGPLRVGVADYCTSPTARYETLGLVMDGLQAINRRRDAFVARLQLQGEELRVMARLMQIAAVEP